jgi:hypothetical protein
MSKLLFLDFDGVLHPNFCPERDYFNRVGLLAEALSDRRGDLQVIISSSWRFHIAFDELLARFPREMRQLVSGATPEVEPGRHQRYREIGAWLSLCKAGTEWRALDDDLAGFPPDCPELIACDGLVGIDRFAADRLSDWLRRAG